MPSLTHSNLGPPPVIDPPGGGGGGDGDHGGNSGPENARVASLTGIIVTMCASAMTFGAFLSAMVIRRGLSNDWHKLPIPKILWYNTVVLLLSSVALDLARRMLRRNRRRYFNPLWTTGSALGT